jgi:hypothetical protein
MRAPKQRTDSARKINQAIDLAIIFPMDVGCGWGDGSVEGAKVMGASVGGGVTGTGVGRNEGAAEGETEGAAEGGSVVLVVFEVGAMDGYGVTMEGALDGVCVGVAEEGATVGTATGATVSAKAVDVDDNDRSVATTTTRAANLCDFFMIMTLLLFRRKNTFEKTSTFPFTELHWSSPCRCRCRHRNARKSKRTK